MRVQVHHRSSAAYTPIKVTINGESYSAFIDQERILYLDKASVWSIWNDPTVTAQNVSTLLDRMVFHWREELVSTPFVLEPDCRLEL